MGAGHGGEPSVVVSVGTDHHPFDRLVTWMGCWAADHPGVRVTIQRGTAGPVASAETSALIPHDELCSLFAGATAVVVHGGPSTVMDARSAGRLPIVVPRRPDLGEHVDDHQVRFAAHLERSGLARVATDLDTLASELDLALSAPDRYRVAVEPGALPGLVAFARVADGLLGVTTTLPSAPTPLSRGAVG